MNAVGVRRVLSAGEIDNGSVPTKNTYDAGAQGLWHLRELHGHRS